MLPAGAIVISSEIAEASAIRLPGSLGVSAADIDSDDDEWQGQGRSTLQLDRPLQLTPGSIIARRAATPCTKPWNLPPPPHAAPSPSHAHLYFSLSASDGSVHTFFLWQGWATLSQRESISGTTVWLRHLPSEVG